MSIEATARKKDKHRKGKAKTRTNVQAEVCWRAGACIVKKGANVSQCDLAGYTAPAGLNCTGCNISRANLRGANLSGVNLTKANLSGSCLVDANLSGATVTNATNLYNAIFCRTTMPDGTVNNSGCGSGTACCSTCPIGGCPAGERCCGAGCVSGVCCADAECAPSGNQCLSAGGGPTFCACGVDAACSGATPDCCPASAGASGTQGTCTNVQTDASNCGSCGRTCPAGQLCQGGACVCIPATCQSLGKTCGTWPDGCGGNVSCGGCGSGTTPACNAGTCATCAATCAARCPTCANLSDGSTRCVIGYGSSCSTCSTNANCPQGQVCLSTDTARSTGQTTSVPAQCGVTAPGVCAGLVPC